MSRTGLSSAILLLVNLHACSCTASSNLDNHSTGERTSSLPWNVLIDNSAKNQSHTNVYSQGQTYYYSPSSYGQPAQNPEPQPAYNQPSSTTSTTTSAPGDFSPQVKSPYNYYNFEGSPYNTASSSNLRNKVTFPGSAYQKIQNSNSQQPNPYMSYPQGYTSSQQSYHSSPPVYTTPNRNSQYYYSNKNRHQDDQDEFEERYKPNSSDDYDDEEDSYPTRSSTIRDHYVVHPKRRPGNKNHLHKYQNSDLDMPDKADYERPEESEKTPTYSEVPWSRYSKYGPYNQLPPGYAFDYDKMSFPGKDSYGTPWAFLLGLLPLGLLMAAMVPNVVSVPLAAAAATAGAAGRRRRDVLRPALQFPVLEAISRFGVSNLDDPKCLQRIFCNITRGGRSDRSNIVQKAFFRIITIIDDDWVERIGLKHLFRAVRTNQCDSFDCSKLDKKDKIDDKKDKTENNKESKDKKNS